MGSREDFDKKIEEQNKKIAHTIWIIFLSAITSIVTVQLYKG